LPAVRTLREVCIQQYLREEPPSGGALHVRWRAGEELPPASPQIHSPYDPEARYAREEGFAWVGYAIHETPETESGDPEGPHLITEVQTTAATLPDQQALPAIQAALERRRLLPGEQLADTG
jgi:hypothetical protein